ncbi:hypothetical protein D3C85_1336940 [compost metagenome]
MVPRNEHLIRKLGECQLFRIVLMNITGHEFDNLPVLAASFPLSAAADLGDFVHQPACQLVRYDQAIDFLGNLVIGEQVIQYQSGFI